jgi:hypothetical protein
MTTSLVPSPCELTGRALRRASVRSTALNVVGGHPRRQLLRKVNQSWGHPTAVKMRQSRGPRLEGISDLEMEEQHHWHFRKLSKYSTVI